VATLCVSALYLAGRPSGGQLGHAIDDAALALAQIEAHVVADLSRPHWGAGHEQRVRERLRLLRETEEELARTALGASPRAPLEACARELSKVVVREEELIEDLLRRGADLRERARELPEVLEPVRAVAPQLLSDSALARSFADVQASVLTFADDERLSAAIERLRELQAAAPDAQREALAQLVSSCDAVRAALRECNRSRSALELYPVARAALLLRAEHARRRTSAARRAAVLRVVFEGLACGLALGLVLALSRARRAAATAVWERERWQDGLDAARKDLFRSRETLEAEVEARARAEAGARQAALAAQAARRAQEVTLSFVERRLSGPIQCLVDNVRQLRRKSLVPARRREVMQRIARQGEDAGDALADIVDLGRLREGSLEVDVHSCSLNVVLEGVERAIEPLAASASLPFEVQVEGGVPDRIETDPARLRRILRNLVERAIHCAESGRVTLAVEHDAGANEVCFSVRHTGRAASPARARFDPHELGASTSEVDGQLADPALAAAGGVIERLGGMLTADGLAGDGRTIVLRLPAARGEPGAARDAEPGAAAPDPGPARRSRGERLVSEYADDEDMLDLIDWFVRDLEKDARRVERALEDGDTDLLAVIAHQLKGSAGSYGFPDLTRQADRLESCARNAPGEVGRLAHEVERLVELCSRVSVE